MPGQQHLHWGAEALWRQLEPLLPGLSVEVMARLPSTNTELLERVRRAGRPGREGDAADAAAAAGRRQADTQPCLLVAETQTQGRGRQGKGWLADAGASLTFSLGLPYAPAEWSGLSLAVGLALAEALDPAPPGQAPRLGLKWPNDLLLLDGSGPGRKLGGILIETQPLRQQRMLVVGVGLNVQPLPAPATPLPWGMANLQELLPGITAPQALARVMPGLLHALRDFERDGFAPLAARFAARDLLAGRAVTTTMPGAPTGVADGVDAQGVLWLRSGSQRIAVNSGEVSLQPAAGSSPC